MGEVRGLGGQIGTCSFQGLINRIGALEKPTCRTLACWLAREAECIIFFLPHISGWMEHNLCFNYIPCTYFNFLLTSA